MALVEYPLEVALSAWGLFSAPPILLHLTDPPSLSAVMPEWLRMVWAASMLLAALTMVLGLHLRHFSTSVARGMVLLATTCAIYGGCIVALNGWDGAASGGLLIVLGGLCHLRAGWLRRRRDILTAVHRESVR